MSDKKQSQAKKNEDCNIDDIEFENIDEQKHVDIGKLREKLKQCNKERHEYLNGWQRSKADFINARKEEEKRLSELKKFVNEDICTDLLSVLDSFEIAFANKKAWGAVDEGWRKGVEYIYSQLTESLRKNGLTQTVPKGEKFDPTIHISVGIVSVKNKEDDEKIAEVVQTGYELHGKLIRPAKVKVGEYEK